MCGEMLYIANLGVDVLRLDALAFVWKEKGMSCESLPKAHILIQAFQYVARIACPSLLFKSEAIVHPDQVIQYIKKESAGSVTIRFKWRCSGRRWQHAIPGF